MSKRRKKEGSLLWIVGICLLAFVVFVIYSISINFSDEKDLERWDIHFTDLTASAVGKADYKLPIFVNTVVENHEVSIYEIGDSVTFQFRVVNDGTQDAILKDVVMSSPRCTSEKEEDSELVCNNLVYKIINEDGTELDDNVTLKKDSDMILNILVEYPSSMEEKPSRVVTINNLDIDLIFSKK